MYPTPKTPRCCRRPFGTSHRSNQLADEFTVLMLIDNRPPLLGGRQVPFERYAAVVHAAVRAAVGSGRDGGRQRYGEPEGAGCHTRFSRVVLGASYRGAPHGWLEDVHQERDGQLHLRHARSRGVWAFQTCCILLVCVSGVPGSRLSNKILFWR